MSEIVKVLVTGEKRDLEESLEFESPTGTKKIEWVHWPVLEFTRLNVNLDLLNHMILKPYDWIIFCSPRAVRMWTEVLVETTAEFPLETQVACIGEATSQAATLDGYNPDFYPTSPGSENFLSEFKDLLSNSTAKPRVLIPQAQGGRVLLAEALRDLGCQVTILPIYRTDAKRDLNRTDVEERLKGANLLVFTSPSSVDAITMVANLPPSLKILALGKFTEEHLKKKGIPSVVLPEGNFERVLEVL